MCGEFEVFFVIAISGGGWRPFFEHRFKSSGLRNQGAVSEALVTWSSREESQASSVNCTRGPLL